ncbi:hypothetical protein BJX64DRAFT_271573 [Aspergillus heterothallicus]
MPAGARRLACFSAVSQFCISSLAYCYFRRPKIARTTSWMSSSSVGFQHGGLQQQKHHIKQRWKMQSLGRLRLEVLQQMRSVTSCW